MSSFALSSRRRRLALSVGGALAAALLASPQLTPSSPSPNARARSPPARVRRSRTTRSTASRPFSPRRRRPAAVRPPPTSSPGRAPAQAPAASRSARPTPRPTRAASATPASAGPARRSRPTRGSARLIKAGLTDANNVDVTALDNASLHVIPVSRDRRDHRAREPARGRSAPTSAPPSSTGERPLGQPRRLSRRSGTAQTTTWATSSRRPDCRRLRPPLRSSASCASGLVGLDVRVQAAAGPEINPARATEWRCADQHCNGRPSAVDDQGPPRLSGGGFAGDLGRPRQRPGHGRLRRSRHCALEHQLDLHLRQPGLYDPERSGCRCSASTSDLGISSTTRRSTPTATRTAYGRARRQLHRRRTPAGRPRHARQRPDARQLVGDRFHDDRHRLRRLHADLRDGVRRQRRRLLQLARGRGEGAHDQGLLHAGGIISPASPGQPVRETTTTRCRA